MKTKNKELIYAVVETIALWSYVFVITKVYLIN